MAVPPDPNDWQRWLRDMVRGPAPADSPAYQMGGSVSAGQREPNHGKEKAWTGAWMVIAIVAFGVAWGRHPEDLLYVGMMVVFAAVVLLSVWIGTGRRRR
jgi:hypothetical protein